MSKKKFKGIINLDIRDSKPDWDPYTPKRAPEGAPCLAAPRPVMSTGTRRCVSVRERKRLPMRLPQCPTRDIGIGSMIPIL